MNPAAGNYFVWHCDWCDSTNYTVWTQLATEGLECGACHHPAGASADDYPVFIPRGTTGESGVFA